jgi:cbb3-type cytochrome oxidase subunit 3
MRYSMSRRSFFIKTLFLYLFLFFLLAVFFLYRKSEESILAEAAESEIPTAEAEVIAEPEKGPDLIIDSSFTFEEAMAGIDIPQEILDDLVLIEVRYLGFDSLLHQGQLLIASSLAREAAEIFEELLAIGFPIERVIPISAYGWCDSLSMAHNNSSCFNYRNILGTGLLSDHAQGRAIDINPMQNPHFTKRYGIVPPGATYDVNAKGTLTHDSEAVRIFRQHGWRWGGRWREYKDYQHFYKG